MFLQICFRRLYFIIEFFVIGPQRIEQGNLRYLYGIYYFGIALPTRSSFIPLTSLVFILYIWFLFLFYFYEFIILPTSTELGVLKCLFLMAELSGRFSFFICWFKRFFCSLSVSTCLFSLLAIPRKFLVSRDDIFWNSSLGLKEGGIWAWPLVVSSRYATNFQWSWEGRGREEYINKWNVLRVGYRICEWETCNDMVMAQFYRGPEQSDRRGFSSFVHIGDACHGHGGRVRDSTQHTKLYGWVGAGYDTIHSTLFQCLEYL